MNGFLNVADHYWKILDRSDDGVYQSKTNSMVPDSDSRYGQWRTVAGDATPIASERELALTLRNRASALPEWLLSAPSFIQPSPDKYSKAQLAAYTVDWRRWKIANGLTLQSGMPITTDTETQVLVLALRVAAANGGDDFTTQWQDADGNVHKLDRDAVLAMSDELVAHINDCFTVSSDVLTKIESGKITRLEEIDKVLAEMAIVNITVANDADFYRVFQYQTLSGVPIDMTGASLLMMLRRRASDETALLRISTDTGEMVLTDPLNGLFSILIPQLELERLATGDYAHSNIMTLGGYKRSIWTGTFTNNPGPSR